MAIEKSEVYVNTTYHVFKKVLCIISMTLPEEMKYSFLLFSFTFSARSRNDI